MAIERGFLLLVVSFTLVLKTEAQEVAPQMLATPPTSSDNSSINSTRDPRLTGDPRKDYKFDPNLPRELNGYDLSSYPFYRAVPEDITFDCEGRHDGYYASVPHLCQVFHYCQGGHRHSFVCANYTVFDQTTFICRFVNNVNCSISENHYDRNNELYEPTTTTTVAPPVKKKKVRPGGKRRTTTTTVSPDEYYDYEYEYEDEETTTTTTTTPKPKRRRVRVRPVRFRGKAKRPRPQPEEVAEETAPMEPVQEDDASPRQESPSKVTAPVEEIAKTPIARPRPSVKRTRPAQDETPEEEERSAAQHPGINIPDSQAADDVPPRGGELRRQRFRPADHSGGRQQNARPRPDYDSTITVDPYPLRTGMVRRKDKTPIAQDPLSPPIDPAVGELGAPPIEEEYDDLEQQPLTTTRPAPPIRRPATIRPPRLRIAYKRRPIEERTTTTAKPTDVEYYYE